MATASTSLERPMPHNVEAERSILGAILLDNNAHQCGHREAQAGGFFPRSSPAHLSADDRARRNAAGHRPGDAHRAVAAQRRTGIRRRRGLRLAVDGRRAARHQRRALRAHREGKIAAARPDSRHAAPSSSRPSKPRTTPMRSWTAPSPRSFNWPKIACAWASSECTTWSPKATSASPRFMREAIASRASRPVTTMLDNLTSGLQPSELIILAARPSMGKTAFALNIAENVGVRGNKPVAIFSLEMSKESLLLRLLSADAKIDSHKFRTGHSEPRGQGAEFHDRSATCPRRRCGSTTRAPPRSWKWARSCGA